MKEILLILFLQIASSYASKLREVPIIMLQLKEFIVELDK